MTCRRLSRFCDKNQYLWPTMTHNRNVPETVVCTKSSIYICNIKGIYICKKVFNIIAYHHESSGNTSSWNIIIVYSYSRKKLFEVTISSFCKESALYTFIRIIFIFHSCYCTHRPLPPLAMERFCDWILWHSVTRAVLVTSMYYRSHIGGGHIIAQGWYEIITFFTINRIQNTESYFVLHWHSNKGDSDGHQ